MEKFILRFNNFNKLYWKKAEQGKPRLLTTRSMGKTIMSHYCFKNLFKNFLVQYKQFLIRYEKIDKWRNKHRRKGL